MDELLRATKEVWEQVGKRETPLVVAALLTNVAFARFENVEQRLKLLCNCPDPEALRSKLLRMRDTGTELETSDENSDSIATQTVEKLQHSWHLLLHSKDNARKPGPQCEPIYTTKPSNILLRIGPNSGPADEKCLSMILFNISQHVHAKCLPTDIVRMGTPL